MPVFVFPVLTFPFARVRLNKLLVMPTKRRPRSHLPRIVHVIDENGRRKRNSKMHRKVSGGRETSRRCEGMHQAMNSEAMCGAGADKHMLSFPAKQSSKVAKAKTGTSKAKDATADGDKTAASEKAAAAKGEQDQDDDEELDMDDL